LGKSLDMTRLTFADASELEFSVHGRNSISEAEDEGLVFYDDVTKVHVLPDEQRFTVQVISPHLQVEMDFPDAGTVREALKLFESKKVSKVEAEAPGSVRLTPVELEPSKEDSTAKELAEAVDAKTVGEALPVTPAPESLPEQTPARPDQRPSENLPDTQRH
jgi:2,3-bisphosphoglycerate-independent phosphoglycerate mutase